ncbi:MAG TPA: DUF4235 domain-containing protein [Solirubrobacteraceae bacterium]|jgi:hypothetical protein|nr:DUF4235 domain-containing protein [Solirubrobacteraceae bacterium]
MLKLMFMPLRLIGGLVAGIVSKKVFEQIWSRIDREHAPNPEFREIPIAKLIAGLALQGAVFRAVRGIVDHAMRVAFFRLTGRWPGEERPEPEAGKA